MEGEERYTETKLDIFTRDEFREVFSLLLRRGIADNLVDTQVAVSSITQSYRARRPTEALHYNDMLGVPKFHPSEFGCIL